MRASGNNPHIHPSEPNYIWAEAGTNFGVFNDADPSWSEGRNVRIDVRWGAQGDSERNRQHAAELVALAPEVILTTTAPPTTALQRATRTIPVVFAMVVDPVGSGIVASLSRPGGNITGFMQFEFSVAGKWLELTRLAAFVAVEGDEVVSITARPKFIAMDPPIWRETYLRLNEGLIRADGMILSARPPD